MSLWDLVSQAYHRHLFFSHAINGAMVQSRLLLGIVIIYTYNKILAWNSLLFMPSSHSYCLFFSGSSMQWPKFHLFRQRISYDQHQHIGPVATFNFPTKDLLDFDFPRQIWLWLTFVVTSLSCRTHYKALVVGPGSAQLF